MKLLQTLGGGRVRKFNAKEPVGSRPITTGSMGVVPSTKAVGLSIVQFTERFAREVGAEAAANRLREELANSGTINALKLES